MRRIGEAIEGARHSIWLTVAFSDDFFCPDGRGPLFDVLDRAVASWASTWRFLVWRPNPETAAQPSHVRRHGPNSARCWRGRGSRFKIRWDRAATVCCQHQKSWMVDGHRAFVGGINLTAKALERHDAYVEVNGPSATDVAHNFVQRWNGASERPAPDGNWACEAADDLPVPTAVSGRAGRARCRSSGCSPPRRPFDPRAIRARDRCRARTIYIENQAIPIPEVARAAEGLLASAASRSCCSCRRSRDLSMRRARIRGGGAVRGPGGARSSSEVPASPSALSVYVHGKLMIVDDAWATIGSCNLHRHSLGGSSEMNASIWDAAVAARYRSLAQHLGECSPCRRNCTPCGVRLLRHDLTAALGCEPERRRAAAGHYPRKATISSLSPEAYGRPRGCRPVT